MVPFLLNAPSQNLVTLIWLPCTLLLIGICTHKKLKAQYFQWLMTLTALSLLGISLVLFQEMYWAGAYNEMDISGETGARLTQTLSPLESQLTLSPFEALLLVIFSFWVLTLFTWQQLQSKALPYSILFKENILWLCVLALLVCGSLLESLFIYALGSLILLWQPPSEEHRPSTTWLFVQHRLGDLALGGATLLLYLTYNTHLSRLWLFRSLQHPLIPLESGYFSGLYSDQVFRWAAFLVFIHALSRLGVFLGVKQTEGFLLKQNRYLRPFALLFLFGGALITVTQTQMFHVNMQWHLAWVLLFLLVYALYLALRSFRAQTLEKSDLNLQLSLFVFAIAATLPYERTGGLILILLFFCVVPLQSITQMSILSAVHENQQLAQLSGLWQTLRSEERIRMIVSFSLTPLILSPAFYVSFLWADWAIAPFFRYGIWSFLCLWSFIFTATIFKPTFQMFSGKTPSHACTPFISKQKWLLALLGLVALLIAIIPNIISFPVHRLKGLIKTDYAPLLNWLGPESNVGLTIITGFRYDLDVLANIQQQWYFYGAIWLCAILGWAYSFIQFNIRKKPVTLPDESTTKSSDDLPSEDYGASLYNVLELILLRISFMAKRVLQPILAGGLLWHLWRTPGSIFRFTFWIFHNGDARRSLSVFFILISVGLYLWSQNI